LAPFVLKHARLRFLRTTTVFRRCRRWAAASFLGTLALLGAQHSSKADDPRPDAAESSAKRPEKPETEFTIVPFVGGNSDMGFGGGYIASLARLDPELQPYRYHIETAGSVTVGQDDADKLRINYTDIYLLFSFPNLIKDRLGLDVRASYTLESNLKYYGLGNASSIDPNIDPTDSFYEHSRGHPTLRVSFEYRMRPIALAWGASYTQNWFDVPEGSRLANDIESPDPEIRELLGEAETHGTPKLTVGAAWDTRDDETSPTRGLYITELIDVTPGTFGPVDYRFARFGTAVHVFVPIIPRDRRLVLATRVANDLLVGDPPFYELPRFEDTFAIGGAKGVRGVPGQRYYGKIKAFANVELRSELFKAKILGDERRFGVVAFTDVGRVWADYKYDPELDGTGLGLKYGVGGGLRVASGETFVLRVDVAWSPDANPLSGYLLAGHIF
jgi:outer membrane protein assembly factor BamA